MRNDIDAIICYLLFLALYRLSPFWYGICMIDDAVDKPPVFDIGVKDAARLLDSCTDYIYKHRDDAGWPRYLRIGRKIKFNRLEFIAWMKNLTKNPTE
jgi:hypothetical protein